MKMYIRAACIAFVLTVLYSLIPFQAQCREISNEVFRIHILANSDSDYDQNLKLKVRDKVLSYTSQLFENAGSKDEAEKIVEDNLEKITQIAQQEVYDNNFDYVVNSEKTKMYFNTRFYENYTLPAGEYDALRIIIGNGKGHNWWCVMYPSICISSAENQDAKAKEVFDEQQYDIVKNEQYEYKFKIVEIFQSICSIFS